MSKQQLRDQYTALVDLRGRFARLSDSAYSGVSAVSWPEKYGLMAPFYARCHRAKGQLGFAKQALEDFITEDNAAVLAIARTLLRASQVRSLHALEFAVAHKGNSNDIDTERQEIAAMAEIEAGEHMADGALAGCYLRLIDVLCDMELLCELAFDGVTAVAWPDKEGSMKPFYKLRADAYEQVGFARLALTKFITAQKASVLDAAEANLKVGRDRALEAMALAFEQKGDVNSSVARTEQIRNLLGEQGWVIN